MSPHDIGLLIAFGGTFFACMAGMGVAVLVAVFNGGKAQSRQFDFAASARRIRAYRVPSSDGV